MNTLPPDDFEQTLFPLLIQRALLQIRASKFKTNDLVEIIGSFKDSEKQVLINGYDPIRLRRPEFIVLLVLAAHARTLQGLPAPRRVPGGPFLFPKEIVAIIDEWRKDSPEVGIYWKTPTPANVHTAIHDLRHKLALVGSGDLIESGPTDGYRISTPSWNIIITMK